MSITNYYVRATNGADVAGQGTTHATAYKMIQFALDDIGTTHGRNAVDGDQINICDSSLEGANVLAASLTLATYGVPTAAAPLILRGYTATANDGGVGSISGADAYPIINNAAYDYVGLIDLTLTNPPATLVLLLNDYCWFINLDINGTGGGGAAAYCIDCDVGCVITGCNLYGVYHQLITHDNSCFIAGNRLVHAPTSSQAAITAFGRSFSHIEHNIIIGTNANACGIREEGATNVVAGNIVYSAAGTGYGIFASAEHVLRGNSVVMNNIVCGFSGVGGRGIVAGDLGNASIVGHNAFWNNTTNVAAGRFIYDLTAHDVALTADPFTDAANGDFSLTDAAKLLLRSAGWPESYLGASTDPHITIGAVQYGEAVTSGGVIRRAMRMIGG